MKKKFEKKVLKFYFLYFFPIFKSPVSGKENVWFPVSPDFDNLPDFRTGRDIWLSPTAFGQQSKLFLPVKTRYSIKYLFQKSKMFNKLLNYLLGTIKHTAQKKVKIVIILLSLHS